MQFDPNSTPHCYKTADEVKLTDLKILIITEIQYI